MRSAETDPKAELARLTGRLLKRNVTSSDLKYEWDKKNNSAAVTLTARELTCRTSVHVYKKVEAERQVASCALQEWGATFADELAAGAGPNRAERRRRQREEEAEAARRAETEGDTAAPSAGSHDGRAEELQRENEELKMVLEAFHAEVRRMEVEKMNQAQQRREEEMARKEEQREEQRRTQEAIENATKISAMIEKVLVTECCICLVEEATIVFVPCGHQCCCAHCAEGIKQSSNKCAICREHVKKYQQIARKIDCRLLGTAEVLAMTWSLMSLMSGAAPSEMPKYMFNVRWLFNSCDASFSLGQVLKETDLPKFLRTMSRNHANSEVQKLALQTFELLQSLYKARKRLATEDDVITMSA